LSLDSYVNDVHEDVTSGDRLFHNLATTVGNYGSQTSIINRNI